MSAFVFKLLPFMANKDVYIMESNRAYTSGL